ncbi:hypothetical protein OG622_47295 [Streptomyces sp. NBC_01314]|nr:hypothetical protein OG622_47295 [Streptomyces sp. NBC_01314]
MQKRCELKPGPAGSHEAPCAPPHARSRPHEFRVSERRSRRRPTGTGSGGGRRRLFLGGWRDRHGYRSERGATGAWIVGITRRRIADALSTRTRRRIR